MSALWEAANIERYDVLTRTALWRWRKRTCPCVFTDCVGFRVGSADCHRNRSWVFWFVVGVELKRRRLSGSTMQSFFEFSLLHATPWDLATSNHNNNFWYHCLNPVIITFCYELSFWGPCNFHPFLGKCPQFQLQPPRRSPSVCWWLTLWSKCWLYMTVNA